MELGDRIRIVIKTKYNSISAFAEEINMNYTQVLNYINGNNRPSMEFIFILIEKFPETNLNWLFKNDEHQTLIESSPTSASQENTEEIIGKIESLLSILKDKLAQN